MSDEGAAMSDQSAAMSDEGENPLERESWIQEVRHRLDAPPPRRITSGEVRDAAVLVPLFVEARELWTVLTQRSVDLPTHKGQIAFPGGGQELGEEMWDTALREAEEEIGLPGQSVLRLGELDHVEAVTSNFRIVPCVGAIPAGFEAKINEAEITEVFTLPLSALAQPQLVEDRAVALDGIERTLRIYHVGRWQIWGLTARVLQNLLRRLGMEGDEDVANPPV
jgi:8-oxo-dGTP pyrophosphatase MutT (NUDIX family)